MRRTWQASPTRPSVGRRAGRGWTLAAVLAVLVTAAVLPAPAQERGVAVDVGRIAVDEVLSPGQQYTLPTIRVRNPGAVATPYVMGVQALESEAASPPAEWFTFSPAEFHLDPDERQPVEVVLTVPHEAFAGEYEVLVTAQIAGEGDGARVGAAAASRLSFAVANNPPSRGFPWWLLVLLAVLILLGLGVRIARRYRFAVERR